MQFTTLEIENWRQFSRIKIDFHSNLTILTGANGSGKTSILNILGQHYNWSVNFVSTPSKNEKTGLLQYLNGLFEDFTYAEFDYGSPITFGLKNKQIGTIVYSDNSQSILSVPQQVAHEFNVNIPNLQRIEGLHINSHRPVYTYRAVNNIPTQPLNKERIYNDYFNAFFQRLLGNYNPNQKSPNELMKESLISFAVFGPGNSYVKPNAKSQELFEGFQEILRQMLPPKIGFKKLSIHIPEVVFETESGDFSIDAVSGGVSSIIDVAWRLFMYSPEGGKFVCSFDEPENHLHPELQQSLLPNLVKAFPNVQFIVATHSPFMISAVFDSFVYVLDYNESNKVESKKLESINKSGTANEILRDVLGLPFTMPLWAEEKFEAIVSKYTDSGVDEKTVDLLEAELAEVGLENFVRE